MNKWIGSGRLIKDAEIRYFPSTGKPYATFTLAIPDPYARKGEPKADFIDCIVYDKQKVDLIEKYIRKGTKLEIVGRLKSGSYTNKEGKRAYYRRIVVTELEFAESREAEQQADIKTELDNLSRESYDFMDITEGADGELPFV
ncbi:MAG: single-stranded DNA-binding protein [Lachnospira sp.]|nr:single-stranded DNA-binding protein [Lachnospira sp.]